MDDLIKDDGVIRKCPSNLAKMGYLKSFKHLFTYKECLNDLLVESDEIAEALVKLLAVVIYISFLPIMPFVRCFLTVRKAKKEVAEDIKRKKGME